MMMHPDAVEENQEEGNILVWLTGLAFLAAMVAIFIYVPTERTEGVVQRGHVFPCAFRLAFIFCVLCGFYQFHSVSLEERAGVGHLCPCLGRDRGDFLFPGIDHRADLGKAYLGSLVGVGRPPHLYPDTLDLSLIHI